MLGLGAYVGDRRWGHSGCIDLHVAACKPTGIPVWEKTKQYLCYTVLHFSTSRRRAIAFGS